MPEAHTIAPLIDYAPPRHPLCVIYQDDDILVLDKPSGLLSVPGKHAHLHDCLEMRAKQLQPKARIVHRLDMHTSGLIIMALHAGAHRNLSRQFELRQVEKAYEALVFGQLALQDGVIDLPLRCDWVRRPLQMVDYDKGKPSQTRYQTIKRTRTYSRVNLFPKTGRSHQLRVHMLAIGHPILGDEFYAHQKAQKLSPRHDHGLCLHAKELTLEHPLTGQMMSFQSQPDF